MAKVQVIGADVADGQIQRLKVALSGLPARVLDRATVVQWMRDGHSFLPGTGRALQLVETDEGWFVRDDHATTAADALPALPPA